MIMEAHENQYRVLGQDGTLPIPLFYGTKESCQSFIDSELKEDIIPKAKHDLECDNITWENNVKWCSLSLYLDSEHDEGKTEFRLRVNADKSFYIHALGKDGKTFDGKL